MCRMRCHGVCVAAGNISGAMKSRQHMLWTVRFLQASQYQQAAFCLEEALLHDPGRLSLHLTYADTLYTLGGPVRLIAPVCDEGPQAATAAVCFGTCVCQRTCMLRQQGCALWQHGPLILIGAAGCRRTRSWRGSTMRRRCSSAAAATHGRCTEPPPPPQR